VAERTGYLCQEGQDTCVRKESIPVRVRTGCLQQEGQNTCDRKDKIPVTGYLAVKTGNQRQKGQDTCERKDRVFGCRIGICGRKERIFVAERTGHLCQEQLVPI
jgi:hypothetical protein